MKNRLTQILDTEDFIQRCWWSSLDGKRPPKKYVEDYVSCKDAFLSAPTLIDFVLHGFSYNEALRMRELFYIEHLKFALNYKKLKMVYTPQELADFEATIENRIKIYNEGA